jgi:MutS domain V
VVSSEAIAGRIEQEHHEDPRAGQSPCSVYTTRLKKLVGTQTIEQRRERRLGFAKLIVAGLTLLSGFLLLHYLNAIEWLPIPIGVFLVLGVLQEKHIRRIKFRARAINFFERGLARLEDRWAGSGETGERFLDPAHPYARDLDLFGQGSLFELLCTARTRAGEQTLAAWLLGAAPIDEIRGRQVAVEEIRPRVGFRAKLFSLGESVRLGVHPEALASWGERLPVFPRRLTRVLTHTLSVLWVFSLVAWGVWHMGDLAVAFTLLNLAWAHRIYRRVDEAAEALEKAADGLAVLSGVLNLLEKETFSAPKLAALQSELKTNGIPPSEAVRKLANLAEYINSRHNPFARLLDVFTFWSAQLLFFAEHWQQEFGPSIRTWLTAVGELEALTALAGYAFEHPSDIFAEVVAEGPVFDAEALAHPLLPAAETVSNDLKLDAGSQLIILSGPNMAGKSTFIRSVGINAVLAQCGAPVRAARLRISPLTVAASICVLDSLSGGVSRFYAEIHRVKLISDLTEGPTPVLFLLDELLSGTNSHDRLTGSEFIVRSLMERRAVGIVSTHDLALTKIAESMPGRVRNCHFEDHYADGQLHFDYKLKPGVVQTSNALELMRSIGLGVNTPRA